MQLKFDNSLTRSLPADPETDNRRRQVRGACYSRVAPTPVSAPYLIAYSKELLELLGLSEQDAQDPQFAQVLSGNQLLPGMDPFAACYGGHQFGSWAGQLGDGRAISLGEVIDRHGGRQELQLKGAGPTPYSRTADGRAVLRSSIREFLCSEAMHHLGIPTTRALSLVGTGELVERDMFYDGRPTLEPGAVVCRVAPSFVRFGSFEIFAARGEHEPLRQLTQYVIRQHFAPLIHSPGVSPLDPPVLVAWFREVCERTAKLVAHWMRVGFVHGVLNTDNMSILGLTIDYGPYGWLDDFNPGWTPNTTDAGGRRYRFGHQPAIAGWNLARLAEALLPLGPSLEDFQDALEHYAHCFEREYRTQQRQKLGLNDVELSAPCETPEELGEALTELMLQQETDMTLLYRSLAQLELSPAALEDASDVALTAPLDEAFYQAPSAETRAAFAGWIRRYARRVQLEGQPAERRVAAMNRANPKYVLRNYLAQLAIDDAERGDSALVAELLDTLRRPYDDQPERAQWAKKRPDWARSRAGCSMLSCSS